MQSDYFKVIEHKKVRYLISAFGLKLSFTPYNVPEKNMKSTFTAETANRSENLKEIKLCAFFCVRTDEIMQGVKKNQKVRVIYSFTFQDHL